MSDEHSNGAQAAGAHENSAGQPRPSHPPFPKDEQITRMLTIMNDALHTLSTDARQEHHQNGQDLFYSCKNWFRIHGIAVEKDIPTNRYHLSSEATTSEKRGADHE